MTAFAARRRRSLRVASGAAIAAIVATGLLTFVGARTLWTSTGGSTVDAGPSELDFPRTPTALIAGLDGGGALASLAVVVDRPDGAGGSVVVAPVSIDASVGQGDERLPVAETASLSGIETVESEASIALGLSFDVVEMADAARLTELLGPFGLVEVTLPIDVTDAEGEVVVEAGTAEMDAAAMAAVLTARDPSVPAADQAPAAAAVWDGIIATLSDGSGSSARPDATVSAESVLAGLSAGPSASWALRTVPVEPDRNPREVDVAVVDRIEASLVFAQIAPGQVSAVNPSASFRIVAAFTPEQLGDRGWTNGDIAFQAIAQVLFLRGNILSVDTSPQGAPETTQVQIMQPGLSVDAMDEVFGDVETGSAEQRIVGVDAELVLGETYLAYLDEAVDRGLVTVGAIAVDPAGDGDGP